MKSWYTLMRAIQINDRTHVVDNQYTYMCNKFNTEPKPLKSWLCNELYSFMT